MIKLTITLALGVTLAACEDVPTAPMAAQGAMAEQTTMDSANVVQLCQLGGDSAATCSCQADSIRSEIGDTKFSQFNSVAARMVALQNNGQKETLAYEALRTQAGQLTAVDGTDGIAMFHALDACI